MAIMYDEDGKQIQVRWPLCMMKMENKYKKDGHYV